MRPHLGHRGGTNGYLNSYLDGQPGSVKIFTFETAVAIRISELIRNDPGLADRLIVTLMRVAVYPQGRLAVFDHLHHIERIKSRHERAALEFGVGIDDRRIMADNYTRTG